MFNIGNITQNVHDRYNWNRKVKGYELREGYKLLYFSFSPLIFIGFISIIIGCSV